MDTYSDTPDNLEKGCSETQPLPYSVQPVQARSRWTFVKHPWIVLGTVGLTWLVLSYGRHAFISPHREWRWAGDSDRVHHASLDGGDVVQCVGSSNWTTYYDQPPWAPEYSYGAEITLSLPPDPDVLYLISQGPLQHGIVNIEQSSDVVDTVDIHVRVAYRDDDALERASVCQMERADNEYGVGIFTHPILYQPSHRVLKDQYQFEVVLTLPAGIEAPLAVKKLETKMPSYSQNVADLQNSVLFDSIFLLSANGNLDVQSVACETCRFSTVNGKISGYFSAGSFLDLGATNGHIEPTVNLVHHESGDLPKLSIHSVHGQIEATVSLTSEKLVGGEFKIDVKSVSGKIGLNFTDTPVDSVLYCRAEATTGGIQVGLDSAFEGTYSLQNALGKKSVSKREVEDPSGKRRQRVISQDVVVGRVDGELRWVESDGSISENEGYVVLRALTGSLKLVA